MSPPTQTNTPTGHELTYTEQHNNRLLAHLKRTTHHQVGVLLRCSPPSAGSPAHSERAKTGYEPCSQGMIPGKEERECVCVRESECVLERERLESAALLPAVSRITCAQRERATPGYGR